jgi:tetratricopeptide (TPR) repeat protein
MNELPDLDSLFVYDDPEGSELRLTPLLERDLPIPYRAELLSRIARCQGLLRRFDEAHKTLDAGHALEPDDASSRIRLALERGRLHNSAGDKAAARPFFLLAFDVASAAHEDALAIDAAHMLGIIGGRDESLDWSHRAIAIAESSNDPKAQRWLASLYNNTGWTHHDAGEYEAALELFRKAHELRQQQPELERVARWCIGRCLRSLGRLDDAYHIQQELYAEYAGGGEGYVEEELAEIALARGNQAEAVPWFKAAHEKLSSDPWLQADQPYRLARLAQLAGVPVSTGPAGQ